MLSASNFNIGIKRVFEPVGFCIYCYTRTGPFTDEHTLPDGLGGRHILPKASCEKCQRIINQVEQYCMRTMLGNVRAHMGIRSRKKRPPVPQSLLIAEKDTGRRSRVYKPIRELPLITVMPAFPPPFILSGLPAPEKFWGANWAPFSPSKEFVESVGAQSVFSEEISPLKFARMLAKIAHSMAVAVYGIDAFQPLLPPLILGERKRYVELVGGSFADEPATHKEIHGISINVKRRVDGSELLIARIRLFGNLGAPIYVVAIGKPWPKPPRAFDPSTAAAHFRYQGL